MKPNELRSGMTGVTMMMLVLLALTHTFDASAQDAPSSAPAVTAPAGSSPYLIDTGPLRVRDQFLLGMGFLAFDPVGSTVGAALAFLISRYLARERVARAAEGNVKFRAIDGAIGEGGWKIVALLRLSPAVPFNLQNYLFGLTRIRFWPYAFTSWLAMMPGTFLYVYLGHLSGAALGSGRERTTWEWIMLAAGLVATIAVTWYVTRLAQRELEKQAQIAPEGGSVAGRCRRHISHDERRGPSIVRARKACLSEASNEPFCKLLKPMACHPERVEGWACEGSRELRTP